MWGQAPVAQALLLLKNDNSAWSRLTSAEQNKVSLLEAAMGYGSNYTYNDANNFSSGICGFGNFSKTNNPNYRDGGVDTEIAAIQFFGASAWDGMLTSFNDATFTSQLDAAGLTNAGQCFAAVGSGADSAIARPFVYSGHHSSDLMGIWSTIAGATFDKTAQSTVGVAHINDGTTSPYDGQCCMGHEFDSTDSSGLGSTWLGSARMTACIRSATSPTSMAPICVTTTFSRVSTTRSRSAGCNGTSGRSAAPRVASRSPAKRPAGSASMRSSPHHSSPRRSAAGSCKAVRSSTNRRSPTRKPSGRRCPRARSS